MSKRSINQRRPGVLEIAGTIIIPRRSLWCNYDPQSSGHCRLFRKEPSGILIINQADPVNVAHAKRRSARVVIKFGRCWSKGYRKDSLEGNIREGKRRTRYTCYKTVRTSLSDSGILIRLSANCNGRPRAGLATKGTSAIRVCTTCIGWCIETSSSAAISPGGARARSTSKRPICRGVYRRCYL